MPEGFLFYCKYKMFKISDFNYLQHLREQYDFLKSDLVQYEDGKPHFGKKIASTLRTIFHDTPKSTAMLPDLSNRHGINLHFRDRANPFVNDGETSFYVGFMVGYRIIGSDHFESPFFTICDFETYWNSPVFKEGQVIYSRRQMILFAANKHGGSHVDPEIPPEFLHLVNGSGPKLISEQCGEEVIITRVAYEAGVQVSLMLEKLIPELGKIICV